MKNYLLPCALAVCGLVPVVASAQDLACTHQVDSCCRQPFDGWYLGGNVGVMSHVARRNDTDGFLTDNAGWSTMDTNVAGGGQVGYDWQNGNCVFGLVTDWNASNISSILYDNPGASPGEQFVRSDLEWFSTTRARAGLAVNDALLYISAGPALAGFDTTWQDAPESFSYSDTRWGWAGSVGSEFQCTPQLSLGAELLYMHFSDENTRVFSLSETEFNFLDNDSAWTGRIMLNYRFGR